MKSSWTALRQSWNNAPRKGATPGTKWTWTMTGWVSTATRKGLAIEQRKKGKPPNKLKARVSPVVLEREEKARIARLAAYVARQPIPRQPNFSPRYLAYIESPQWEAKRQELFAARGRLCERCRKPARVLQVHHHTYARLGHEDLDDLVILCHSCHEREHNRKF